MARPRKEIKTEYVRIHIDLSIENGTRFHECYKKSGCNTKVQFLMQMVNNYDRLKRIKEIDDALFEEILRHRRLILGVANNINQIAKQVNTLGFAAEKSDIKYLLEDMNSILPDLKERSDELLKKTNIFLKEHK